MEQVVVSTGQIPHQTVQTRIDLTEPAAVVDAVGDVGEFPGLHDAGVMEHIFFQNLGVQAGHAVDRHSPGDAQIGHTDLAAPDDGHFLCFAVVMVEALHLFLPAVGNLQHDLPDAGQQCFKKALGPALQRLGQNGVVRVGHGLGGDVPCLIPAHTGLVHENPHQLRNHKGRVGIVDLKNVLFVEIFQRAVGFQMLGDNGLHRGGDKEILLL